MTWTTQLADQLDWHWRNALRPRLAGLTDDEYFWEPVTGCWTEHRGSGAIDFAYPPRNPSPSPRSPGGWLMSSSACWR